MIFDESTLRKLNRLTLVATQVRAGVMKGDRRSVKRGSSIEFADYRDYTPGDDLRRVDWNVYARLDRPFMKLFEEEEDLAVHVLIDGSQSMDWGAGEQNKFQYALRLAGALGAIALAGGDRLTVAILSDGKSGQQIGPVRGVQNTLQLLQFLERQKAGGITDLNHSLRHYAMTPRRPGVSFLISDLFCAEDHISGLAQLQSRGHEVSLLHILAPEELDPPLAGDLRLMDVENGQAQDVSLDSGMRALYRRKLLAWRDEIQATCKKRSVRYLGLSTAQTWDRVVLHQMRSMGVVK
jgi:uncharacterized protein (DUF58 family)